MDLIKKQVSERIRKMYPCKECLVSICCSKLCDMLPMDIDYIISEISKKICPDCGNQEIVIKRSNRKEVKIVDRKCIKCKHIIRITDNYKSKIRYYERMSVKGKLIIKNIDKHYCS